MLQLETFFVEPIVHASQKFSRLGFAILRYSVCLVSRSFYRITPQPDPYYIHVILLLQAFGRRLLQRCDQRAITVTTGTDVQCDTRQRNTVRALQVAIMVLSMIQLTRLSWTQFGKRSSSSSIIIGTSAAGSRHELGSYRVGIMRLFPGVPFRCSLH